MATLLAHRASESRLGNGLEALSPTSPGSGGEDEKAPRRRRPRGKRGGARWKSLQLRAGYLREQDGEGRTPTFIAGAQANLATSGLGKLGLPGTPSEPTEAELMRAAANSAFTKTRLCRFYAKGICKRGEGCTYAHTEAELRALPDVFRTKLCPLLSRTGRCMLVDCTYAHKEDELYKAAAGQGMAGQDDSEDDGDESDDEGDDSGCEDLALSDHVGQWDPDSIPYWSTNKDSPAAVHRESYEAAAASPHRGRAADTRKPPPGSWSMPAQQQPPQVGWMRAVTQPSRIVQVDLNSHMMGSWARTTTSPDGLGMLRNTVSTDAAGHMFRMTSMQSNTSEGINDDMYDTAGSKQHKIFNRSVTDPVHGKSKRHPRMTGRGAARWSELDDIDTDDEGRSASPATPRTPSWIPPMAMTGRQDNGCNSEGVHVKVKNTFITTEEPEHTPGMTKVRSAPSLGEMLMGS
eukprot:TRINITY_DN17379_c0_g1_i1.p1 TRINITY_DN17379_c0_g1~~TRINITY_DN17379_c0_g1_i1.p1  ORF type:complete len:462 (+),score=80.80 TRINITY_DN17379_c0_g1_i1:98-1483(+)